MNLISTMLGFIGRKIKNLETEVGNINSTLDDVSPAPKVIPIERGGTGATTTNGALDNLFGESPLPISRGGTGATTTNGALDNLLGESPLPISRGGTGATNTQDSFYNMFNVVERTIDNQTIAAGTSKEITYDWNIAGSCVLVGWYLSNATSSGQNVSNVSVYGAYINANGNKFVIKCKNTGSSNAKVKATFKILTWR